MDGRDFIKKLIDKDLDSNIAVVVNTNEGRFVVPIDKIYQSEDLCIEVICKTEKKENMRLIDANVINFRCSYSGDCMADEEKCKKCSDYVCDFEDIQNQPTINI